ncbi:hypothetical protein OIU79_024001 [Salix purpurea]|uniref:Uncharacterized protein n=1 Tax=Salix purpurea TaxID=77065 RepID=A0A9Q1A9N5_SALPP|nr:hypothetical protein OIU79_024001 [Salix purpurea]
MDPRELKQGIAELYDQSSGVWEDIWGVHMHHGFYNPDDQVSGSGSDHRAAQIRMIEEALRFTGISGLNLNDIIIIIIYIYSLSLSLSLSTYTHTHTHTHTDLYFNFHAIYKVKGSLCLFI